MSYNLHQGYATSGAQDLEALAGTIEAAGADVVALQEVSRGWVINGSTEMLTWMARRLRMSFVWGPAADAVWGNAILSRRRIARSAYDELPRGGAPMRRGVLWAEIDLGRGERLLVIATHFHQVEAEGEIRVPQAAAVLRVWNRRDRTVVMGDLNATPDAPEIALLKDAGLRDAFALAGQGSGLTYSSATPERRIDYIWVSPDLRARDFRVLPGQASDHLGIAVVVGR
jgi:endonuclease/exonuclease/phosphatase family metal-dependent hydrolase